MNTFAFLYYYTRHYYYYYYYSHCHQLCYHQSYIAGCQNFWVSQNCGLVDYVA